jgi:hypothetical protein
MTKDESPLDKIKKEYAVFEKKYSLPSFERLNEDFVIERISEEETDFLVREIRRHIAEKLSNSLRIIDILLNPSNTPAFLMPAIKAINKDEKEILEKTYKRLSKNEIVVVKLDLNYSIDNEIKYIKESYTAWQEIKKDLAKTFETIEKNWDKKAEKNSNGYFG